jgi:hypothetical protein
MLMSVVIKIEGIVTGNEISRHDGRYLKSYSPDGNGGAGRIVSTIKLDDAARFDASIEAITLWQLVSKTHPIRRDGEPNRPFTMYTISIEPG